MNNFQILALTKYLHAYRLSLNLEFNVDLPGFAFIIIHKAQLLNKSLLIFIEFPKFYVQEPK